MIKQIKESEKKMEKEDEEVDREYDDGDWELGKYDYTDIKKIMREEGEYSVETKNHRHYLVNGFRCHRFGYYFYERIGDNIHYLYKLDYNKVINIRKVK